MIRKHFSQFVLVGVALMSASSSYAAISPDGLWGDVASKRAEKKAFDYRSLNANKTALIDALKNAPYEGSNESGLELYLPLPEGEYTRVSVFKSAVMSAELAEEFPEIQTFRVKGLDDKSISGALDFGPNGFHGMLLSDSGTIHIEPETAYSDNAENNIFRSFKKSSYPRSAQAYRCNVKGHDHSDNEFSVIPARLRQFSEQSKSAGSKKRTYRLAVGATAEYTAAVSTGAPTVAKGQAAIVTAIARLNEIYEKEVSVSFTLVPNNSSIVFASLTSDSYVDEANGNATLNNNGSALLDENQTKLDAVIGSANYDIGHVFSTGGGGVAAIASVCDDASDLSTGSNRKAQGVTGLPNPVGDPFVVDYVAHEVGHQFGAPHTFNAGGNTSGSCDDSNRENHTSTTGGTALSDSAYEPGSGSTIMAYAGICSPQNIQNRSDAYFHARSLEQIRDFVENKVLFSNTQGGSCGVETNTGDTEPTAEAGSNYTIPANTPFALTGSGSDADAGDAGTLTYTWEQYDLGTKTTTLAEMHTDADTRPIVRSRTGTNSPTRYIPALDAILEGNLTKYLGERLPTTDRDMKFRLTVRSGAQGFNQDDMTVTVDKDSGPLVVTAPAAASTHSGLSSTAVTWNVANTTATPVNCANMEIAYSNDGGQNFSTTLLASTPNDGSQNVILPNETTTQGRIKVQCVNNIFFNVSPGDFNINAVGSLSIAATSAVKVEGDTGNTAYTFTITRSGVTAGTAAVNYAVTSATANAADFGGTLPSGVINFANGDATETLTINVSGDNVVESDEAFTVTLSSPTNAVVATASANGTIQNDDGIVSIAAASAVKAEGDNGNTAYTFTISRSDNTAGAAGVDYAVTGTANATDFGGTLPTGTINFADGDSSETLTINVSGDNTVEGDESFTVTLSNPSNAVIGTASANGTIQNDDGTLSIAAASAVKAEGDSGNTAYTFTISRTDNTAGAASVNYAVTGTANATDFGGTLPTGTINFADGDSSETLTINVSGDNTVEGDESFTVTLSNPSNAVIGTASANGTIQNDDGGISIAATSAVKVEGDTGTTAYTFTLTRSGDTSGVATVNYGVSGAAVNAADFGGVLPSGVITFADGDGSETLTVNVSGDNDVENDEVFTVTISNPSNAVIGAATANGTIQNDDGSLAIVASAAVKPEGDAGTTAYTFTVNRSSNTAGVASVDYAVTGIADAADFGGSLPSGTINFADGDASETLTINVSGDHLVEANENFTVTLSNPTNAVITTTSASGTIQNDDGSFSIAATSTVKPEGDSGTTAYTFTVTRAADTSGAASVDYALTSTQADSADFGGVLPSGTINFADGVASQSLTINVVGDNAVEANEGFTVTLSNPTNAVVATATATGIIQNDDGSLAIAATSAIKAEGDAGNTAYTFTITRSDNTSGAASVNYAVTSATADASDFGGALPSGTVNFADGAVSQIVTINVAGDNTVEADEIFTVTLSSPSNAVLSTAAANGTIQNDDSTVSIAANSAVKAEGNTGTTAYTFTITRADDTSGVASVSYAVTSSTANAADFGGSLPSGTINFADGDSTETLTINVSADTDVEANEDFTVTLSAPVNTVIGTASANGTIENDDAAIAIAALNADRLENEGTFTFTVTRSGDTTTAVSASYLVSGTGSHAADATDFGGSFTSGTVSFAAGVTSQTITINVSNDADVESAEGFLVTLSSPSAGAIINTATAEGVIKNDDGPVEYSITALAADQAEGNTGTTAFTFNVIRSGNPLAAGTETIDYAVTGSGANAASAADFGGSLASGTVTFGAGQHTQLVTINVSGDQDLEASEGFSVTLSNASAGTITTATAEGVIQNDDAALSISEPTIIQPTNNGQYTFVFTITRTAGVIGSSSVDYIVAGSGSNPVTAADFGGSFPSGTVSFAPGQNSAELRVNVSASAVTAGDKSFTITISNPVNAAIAVSSATATLSGSGLAPTTVSSSGGGGGAMTWWLLLLFVPMLKRRS